MRVLVAAGTWPEVIKLAPIIQALRRTRSHPDDVVICGTGQQRGILDQAMTLSDLRADIDLTR